MKKCTGFMVADIYNCIDEMRDLYVRRDTYPGPVHAEELRDRSDVDLFQPEYVDFTSFLNKQEVRFSLETVTPS